MKKLISSWLPVLIWAAVIFYFSNQPYLQSDLPGAWDFALRKTAHVTEFFIFTLILIRALTAGASAKQWGIKKILVTAITFGVLYAVSDECHQGFIAGRHPALKDVGFDTIGVLLASVAWLKFKIHLAKKSNNGKI